jgi:hypothetical protein
MSPNHDSTLDSLALLVQAIGRDWKLRQWFLELTQKTVLERSREISTTTNQMAAQHEDAQLVASLNLLGDPTLFDAVQQTLREHGRIND